MTYFPRLTDVAQGGDAALTLTYQVCAVADGSVVATRTVKTNQIELPMWESDIRTDMADWVLEQAQSANPELTMADVIKGAIAKYTDADWQRWGI